MFKISEAANFFGMRNMRLSGKIIARQLHLSSAIASPLAEIKKTGAFKSRLPDIFDGPTHYKRALRSLEIIEEDYTIKNSRNRNRKFASQSIDALMKGLTIPLTELITLYASFMHSLHPYEATVADLTIIARVKVGNPDLQTTLNRLRTLRASTSRIAKDYAGRANNVGTALEARKLMEKGFEQLKMLYESSEAEALMDILGIQKDLRLIPVVELDVPTVVLVGSPNVGKSSIVHTVSSGTPEVSDFPFTTRGVTIGHIIDGKRDLHFQVMDTPGLLDRPDEERNEMERLTFASLARLPTAVIFVIDPSGMAGEQSSLQAQLNVRNYLRTRFPKRPWLDVVSKGDLDIPDEILDMMPDGYLHVSVKSGRNIELLKQEMEKMFLKLEELLAEKIVDSL